MSLPPGHRLGSFEVVALLGSGGMGEVYRARDTRLHREVAVKVLPAQFLSHADRRARFEREAQVLASLNHPHIAHIYGLEHADSGDALIMELVEGRTLADRLRTGPLGLAEALEIARQIADALEAAHDRGIVHRDLKPANIKVRDDGTVKVLDFGLAKALGAEPADGSSGDFADSPTMSAPAMTERGVILGTAGYMSPEQARGRAVDQRTDIWAFGCVLYELVTGQRAFGGDNLTDVLASVVSTEPDLSRAPVQVRRLLRACLQKDPRRRLRHIGDAVALVDDAAIESGTTAARASRTSGFAMAALGLVALAAIGWAILGPGRTLESPSMRFELPISEGLLGRPDLSPDGQYLLQTTQLPSGAPHLVLRSIATGEVRDVPATEDARFGFWSPDSQSIGFTQRGALKTIPVGGGQPTVVAPSGVGDRGCWGPDGFIVMNRTDGISKVPAGGGAPVAVTTVDRTRGEIHHEQPACMPDGRFLYYRHLRQAGTSGIYLGDPRLAPDQQRLTPILVAADGPVFVPGTKGSQQDLLFMQDATLFVQAFDFVRAAFAGERRPLADPVGSAAGSGLFSASATGVLVFATRTTVERQLTWIDRNGTLRERAGPPIRVLRGLRIAPDGTRVMLVMFPQDRLVNNDDLAILPFDGRPLTPFTTDEGVESSPMWSADGMRVAYLSGLPASASIVQRPVEGGAPESMVPLDGLTPLNDWSRDGRFVLLAKSSAGTGTDIFVMRVSGANRKLEPLIQGPANETGPTLSPDGHWLAYLSDESSRNEVYVRRFDVSADGAPSSPESGRRLVSNGGARGLIRWRRDGRELTYMGTDGKLMAVEVTPAPTLTLGTPRPLFTFPEAYLRVNPTGTGFADMMPDGSRWLIAMPPESAHAPTLQVIVNWRSAGEGGR